MGNELSQSLTERELGTLKEFVENTLRKSGIPPMEMLAKEIENYGLTKGS